MRGFVLYVPNTRLREVACYMFLALGLKGRIRRSGIGVFPRRVACYTSLALGLKGRIRRSGIGVFPEGNCVPYVPSTRVLKRASVGPKWLSKEDIFHGNVSVLPA